MSADNSEQHEECRASTVSGKLLAAGCKGTGVPVAQALARSQSSHDSSVNTANEPNIRLVADARKKYCKLLCGAGTTISTLNASSRARFANNIATWLGLLRACLQRMVEQYGLQQALQTSGIAAVLTNPNATHQDYTSKLEQFTTTAGRLVGVSGTQMMALLVGALLVQLEVDTECDPARALAHLCTHMHWVMTTNYDDFIECITQRPLPLPLAQWRDLYETGAMAAFQMRKEAVLHLHGHRSQLGTGTMVLLPRSYQDTLPAFVSCMRHALGKGPVIIVGASEFGMTDGHFRPLWEALARDNIPATVHIIVPEWEVEPVTNAINSISAQVASWAQQDHHVCVHSFGGDYRDFPVYVQRLCQLIEQA